MTQTREDKAEYQAKRHRERRKILDVLRDNPCVDCDGEFPIECMEFDHVPERGPKIANVATLVGSPRRFLEELAKCDLVCANCHKIRTARRKDEN
jgi:hypothetical protein